MPLDPSISLAVKPPDFAGGGGNALGMIAPLTKTMNDLNQLKLFQQTFAARQRLGEIVSQSPDLETGLRSAASDPLVAGFAGQALGELRSMQQTMTTTRGLEQTQINNAAQAVVKGAASALVDPGQFGKYVLGGMQQLPAGLQTAALPFVKTWMGAMTDGLPADTQSWTPAQKLQFQNRLIGSLYGAGYTPEAVQGLLGKPEIVEQGNVKTPGLLFPPQAGPGITMGGPGLPVGTPPSYQPGPGGVPIPVPGLAGGSVAPAPTGVPSPAGTSGNALAPSLPASVAAPDTTGGIGALGQGAGGLPIVTEAQSKLNDKLVGEFNDQDLKMFRSAQTGQAALRYMDRAYDQLIDGGKGGMLTPGTLAEFRTGVARGVNTLAQALGKAPPFDAEKVASAEELMKQTNNLVLQVKDQFFGGSREAASVIEGIGKQIPGIENTYLGSKLLLDSVQAAFQRVIDQRNFENSWQARNKGYLVGAAEAFNKANPSDGYVDQVLGKYGLSEKGFTDPQAVGNAVKMGWLTQAQGADALRRQFPTQFH